jgi:hypothetical protein
MIFENVCTHRYKYASPELYPLFAAEFTKRNISKCSAQELANLAWALTAAGGKPPGVDEVYSDVVLAIAQTCVERKLVWKNPNDVRNILSCLVKARVPDAGLCAEVAAELSKKKEAVTLRAYVQAFWMFAHQGFNPPASLVAHFQRKVETGTLVYSDTAYISKAHYSVRPVCVFVFYAQIHISVHPIIHPSIHPSIHPYILSQHLYVCLIYCNTYVDVGGTGCKILSGQHSRLEES